MKKYSLWYRDGDYRKIYSFIRFQSVSIHVLPHWFQNKMFLFLHLQQLTWLINLNITDSVLSARVSAWCNRKTILWCYIIKKVARVKNSPVWFFSKLCSALVLWPTYSTHLKISQKNIYFKCVSKHITIRMHLPTSLQLLKTLEALEAAVFSYNPTRVHAV